MNRKACNDGVKVALFYKKAIYVFLPKSVVVVQKKQKFFYNMQQVYYVK